jgi:hypothetical protein
MRFDWYGPYRVYKVCPETRQDTFTGEDWAVLGLRVQGLYIVSCMTDYINDIQYYCLVISMTVKSSTVS